MGHHLVSGGRIKLEQVGILPDGRPLYAPVVCQPKPQQRQAVREASCATEADVRAILAVIPKNLTGKRNKALLLIAAQTGLRVAEMAHLLVAHLDLTGDSPSLLVRSGKGNKDRTVPLPAEAAGALQDWLAARQKAGITCPEIFCAVGAPGRGLSVRQVCRTFYELADKAGIQKILATKRTVDAEGHVQEVNYYHIHPHAFRHFYATYLEDEGVQDSVISELLGHSSIAVTQRYLHPSEKQKQATRNVWKRLQK